MNQRVERTVASHRIVERGIYVVRSVEEIDSHRIGARAGSADRGERRIGRGRTIGDRNVRETIARKRRGDARGQPARRAGDERAAIARLALIRCR